MKIKTEQFTQVVKREIADLNSRAFLQLLPPVIAAMRKAAMATFPDPDAANEYSRAIRAEVVARLPELLEEFEVNAIARGAKVIWARDAEEANDFILN
ncbi:MAG: (4Fe-4S)-binding protein, partial [Thermodesulfobacteriota bacterium]|nr:(4Fe-4S)-binding protein [Thermodesulfobacteriota bacterium]